MASTDTDPTLDDFISRISVTGDEVLAAVVQRDSSLVQLAATEAQNLKMRVVLSDLLSERFDADEVAAALGVPSED